MTDPGRTLVVILSLMHVSRLKPTSCIGIVGKRLTSCLKGPRLLYKALAETLNTQLT